MGTPDAVDDLHGASPRHYAVAGWGVKNANLMISRCGDLVINLTTLTI
jgi:hypothetical protein